MRNKPKRTYRLIVLTTSKSPSRKRAAFTLAEVLITLGIIGVVAAITMPSVIQKHQEQVIVTKVKKGYNQLLNALDLYTVQNSCDNLLCLFDNKNKINKQVAQELATMFQGAEVCTNSTSKKCKSYPIKQSVPYKRDGKYAAGDTFSGGPSRVILPNGVFYRIDLNSECIRTVTGTTYDEYGYKTGEYTYEVDSCAQLYMDVNGTTGPNQFGADVYRWDVKSDGTLYSNGGTWYGNIKSVMLDGKLNYTKYNIGDEVK